MSISKEDILVQRLEPILLSDTAILLIGPTGSGKEFLAEKMAKHRWQTLQAKGKNPQGQVFVPINIAAYGEAFLRSELFGYVKGAFTGAEQNKPGIFETAGDGTVFLDEIGDLPYDLQVQLLRIIENRKVCRLGDVPQNAKEVRCLIIAATNRYEEVIKDPSKFRQDLRMRFQKEIILPSLFERLNEFYNITQSVIYKYNNQISTNKQVQKIKHVSAAWLLSLPFLYDYIFSKGNIRALMQIVKQDAKLLQYISAPYYWCKPNPENKNELIELKTDNYLRSIEIDDLPPAVWGMPTSIIHSLKRYKNNFLESFVLINRSIDYETLNTMEYFEEVYNNYTELEERFMHDIENISDDFWDNLKIPTPSPEGVAKMIDDFFDEFLGEEISYAIANLMRLVVASFFYTSDGAEAIDSKRWSESNNVQYLKKLFGNRIKNIVLDIWTALKTLDTGDASEVRKKLNYAISSGKFELLLPIDENWESTIKEVQEAWEQKANEDEWAVKFYILYSYERLVRALGVRKFIPLDQITQNTMIRILRQQPWLSYSLFTRFMTLFIPYFDSQVIPADSTRQYATFLRNSLITALTDWLATIEDIMSEENAQQQSSTSLEDNFINKREETIITIDELKSLYTLKIYNQQRQEKEHGAIARTAALLGISRDAVKKYLKRAERIKATKLIDVIILSAKDAK